MNNSETKRRILAHTHAAINTLDEALAEFATIEDYGMGLDDASRFVGRARDALVSAVALVKRDLGDARR